MEVNLLDLRSFIGSEPMLWERSSSLNMPTSFVACHSKCGPRCNQCNQVTPVLPSMLCFLLTLVTK